MWSAGRTPHDNNAAGKEKPDRLPQSAINFKGEKRSEPEKEIDSPATQHKRDFGAAEKLRVLFICTHNAVRSQMAEGYIRTRYSDLFDAASAGSEPRGVHPLAIAVMDEIGIDISGQRSKPLEEFFHTQIDIVIKVCDCEHRICPFFSGAGETINAGFPDPSEGEMSSQQRIAFFRQVRDAIIAWIDQSFVPGYRRSKP